MQTNTPDMLKGRRNGYLWTSGVNLDTAVHSSISYYSAEFRRFGDVFRWLLHFIFWMSAIFLLPVCLTYWTRKYITRVDPHVDNSHHVWSWYDNTLPSYRVLSTDTSRDFVTLWPWPWTVAVHGTCHMSRDQPCYQVWRPYAYQLLIYES